MLVKEDELHKDSFMKFYCVIDYQNFCLLLHLNYVISEQYSKFVLFLSKVKSSWLSLQYPLDLLTNCIIDYQNFCLLLHLNYAISKKYSKCVHHLSKVKNSWLSLQYPLDLLAHWPVTGFTTSVAAQAVIKKCIFLNNACRSIFT